MKTTFFSIKPFEIPLLEKANKDKHELIFQPAALSLNTTDLISRESKAISAFSNDDLSSDVLESIASIGIKYIAMRSAGYDNIDMKKVRELSFTVANVPDYSPFSIAEHTVMMILALNRKLIRGYKNISNFDFRLNGQIGFDLNQKTVGIIGTGRIGGLVAKILHGFGCNLLGYDIDPDLSLEEMYGLKYVELDELCSSSHIVTLHCPLNENTARLISQKQIEKMKNGVMLINTSRGAVINTVDVINGLLKGKIGYLGIDVYEKERGLFFYNHSDENINDNLFIRLMSLQNVLITAHQAFLTKEAIENIAVATIDHLDCWEKGLKSRNEL